MSQLVCYTYHVKEKEIKIQLQEIYSGDFGICVWPSSDFLANLIFQNELIFQNQVVLELGCGPGLAGIAAAKCHVQVILTDLKNPSTILENCRYNCQLNHVEQETSVIPLEWGCISEEVFQLPAIDMIIGSDLFYDTKVLDDFLCTFSFLLERNPSCRYLFLFPERISIDTIEYYFRLWKIDIHFEIVDFNNESIHQMILGTSPNLHLVI